MERFKIIGFRGEPAPAGDDPIYRGEGMMHSRALDRKTRRPPWNTGRAYEGASAARGRMPVRGQTKRARDGSRALSLLPDRPLPRARGVSQCRDNSTGLSFSWHPHWRNPPSEHQPPAPSWSYAAACATRSVSRHRDDAARRPS